MRNDNPNVADELAERAASNTPNPNPALENSGVFPSLTAQAGEARDQDAGIEQSGVFLSRSAREAQARDPYAALEQREGVTSPAGQDGTAAPAAPVPPPPGGHDVRTLAPQLEAAGVFEPAVGQQCVWFAGTLAAYGLSFAGLCAEPAWYARAGLLGLGCLGFVQAGLFAHEAGHGAVTKRPRLQLALGQLAYSFLNGFSYSYWRSTHDTHHELPNREGADPDLEASSLALYETAARRIGRLEGLVGEDAQATLPPARAARRAAKRAIGRAARWIAAHQPASLLLAFALWAFFMKLDGVQYVRRAFSWKPVKLVAAPPSHRPSALTWTAVDALCILAHLALWLVLPLLWLSASDVIVNYVVLMVLKGFYMGGILVVPHVGTGTEKVGEDVSFFERQVRFSRNYDGGWLGTVLSGGLNLQIEHHLLPYVSGIRLRRARAIVAAYCEKHGLPYRQTSYREAWRQVLTFLRRMAGIVKKCSSGGDPGS